MQLEPDYLLYNCKKKAKHLFCADAINDVKNYYRPPTHRENAVRKPFVPVPVQGPAPSPHPVPVACYGCTHRKYRFEYVTIDDYPSRASLNAFPHGKIMGKIAQVRAGFRAELRQPARVYTILPSKTAKERYDMNLEN